MATDRKPPAQNASDGRTEPLIRTFLGSFEQITNAFGRSIQSRVSDASTRTLAEHLTTVLNTQAGRLTALVLETYDQAGPAKRVEVDQLLARQAAAELTRGVAEIAASAASAPALKGISDIITLIKKIIKFIIELFGNVPPWLNNLLELIDEIVGSLGGLFNFRLQRDINQTEVDYLKSMYYLQRLNMLEAGATSDDNDDR